MGVFGKKEVAYKKQRDNSDEEILKDELQSEVEGLQKEFRKYQDEINNITKKMQIVKEEYESVVNNLMLIKKEMNLEKMELDAIRRDYKNMKSKMEEPIEKIDNNKKVEEINKTDQITVKMKQDIEKLSAEYNNIQNKIQEENLTLQGILEEKTQIEVELEEIKSKKDIKQQEMDKIPDIQKFEKTEMLASGEKKFIKEEIKKESKGIIEAASIVVGKLKSKLRMTEKELQAIQILLEKERNEHTQTKNEFEKFKRNASKVKN